MHSMMRSIGIGLLCSMPHEVRWTTVDASVRMEVLDWHGSGPPLVLIAWYLTAHWYDDFAPNLTNQFHVFGITRRGIGASDKPTTGYSVQRSADDLLETLDALDIRKTVLVGTSCAGQVQTLFASQHSDRLTALVYFDGASDPTITGADVNPPMPALNTLPRLTRTSTPDRSSFAAFRLSRQRAEGMALPEAEWRQEFAENPDGSVGESLMSQPIRRAITVDARMSQT
jgi:pimeloyl-ACP methyl ester carboxylesterase